MEQNPMEITTTTNSSKPPSLFLFAIPIELRLQIYEDLLVLPTKSRTFDYVMSLYALSSSPNESPLVRYMTTMKGTNDSPRIHQAILFVCRQTYAEARPVLYRKNVFLANDALFTAAPMLRPYYRVVKGHVAGLIRKWHIRLRLDAPSFFSVAQITQAFSGCDELTISLWQSTLMKRIGAEQLAKFEGVREVNKVVIRGVPPGFEGYASWLEARMMSPQEQDSGHQKHDGYVAKSERERKRLSGWS